LADLEKNIKLVVDVECQIFGMHEL